MTQSQLNNNVRGLIYSFKLGLSHEKLADPIQVLYTKLQTMDESKSECDFESTVN